MAEETVKQTVGKGTEAQIVISMQPLVGEDGSDYSLSDLDWECTFEGTAQYKVLKTDAVMLSNDSYECIVDTGVTGVSANIKAWLTVKNIPTVNGRTRKEVTPPMLTNLEVI